MSATEYGHIVRIAGKDIDGSKKLVVALSKIKGIGFNFAQVLLNTLQIDPNLRVGFLSENEVSIIENGIKNPENIGIPQWFLNRRKDVQSGVTSHNITTDWDIVIYNDVEREKGVMSWRGFRHMMGLKVRGQCTRTTGRKGGAVGVRKIGKAMPTAPGGAIPTTTAAATTAKETPSSGAKQESTVKAESKPTQDKSEK
ncbi:MAG: 30S ribosomal protein S13 [Thaumarchaeota archaeon]|nr:30S ribosomal protein S13 [Nitrososphaerota archaeon]